MPEQKTSHKAAVSAQAQGALQLQIAFIGISNGLFAGLGATPQTAPALAQATGNDGGYVTRWLDAAYAFDLVDCDGDRFSLTPLGRAFLPDSTDSLMPFAVQSVLTAHMSTRASEFMRTGERPGESVLAERPPLLPWFGPMLEQQFLGLFEREILPRIDAFKEANAAQGLVIDLGCGNGWYLRAVARHFANLHGLGIDGFQENIRQAEKKAAQDGVSDRLQFSVADIYTFTTGRPAHAITMTRALHHVWDERERVFEILRAHLTVGGAAVLWEPNWPAQRQALRDPMRRVMAFQNLTEHVQGNHFLRAEEIAAAARAAGLTPSIHLFAADKEAVIVARKEAS
ncbi:MAG TPA: class I SAM-dependent methyltransferase [Acidiferrobacteraceae bacterium]|nr:class I SAM-dependent methyltransferase [Acidiferrobacteraceae bacterium]